MNPLTTLFAGTDFGLYATEDGGITWVKDTRVPNVVVSSIKISANQKEIYFFTHGRGVFKGLINNNAVVDTKKIIQQQQALLLFPVPANGLLNIKTSEENIGAEYQIFNAQGQLVMEGTIDTFQTSINTNELASGNYIFNMNLNGKKDHQIFTISR